MSIHRTPRSSVWTLILALALLPALAAVAADDKPAKFYDHGLHGVDLGGLTPEQEALALKVLNASPCTCGCGMTVAQCRVEDQNCDTSPPLAQAIVDAVRRGGSEDDAIAAYRKAAAGSAAPAAAPAAPERHDIPVGDSPARGPADAPVTIIEFADFQCPFSLRADGVLRQAFELYPGRLRLVYKHLPLSIHPQARSAAVAAEAAREQDHFWEMHDLLFRNPGELDREAFLRYAGELGLDLDRFAADLDSGELAARVDADIAAAEEVQAAVTPTLFVNGKRLRNYMLNTVRRAIEEALDSPTGGAGR